MDSAEYLWDLIKAVIPWALTALTGWLGYLQINKASKTDLQEKIDDLQTNMNSLERRTREALEHQEGRMEASINRISQKIDEQNVSTHRQFLQIVGTMITKEDLRLLESRLARGKPGSDDY